MLIDDRLATVLRPRTGGDAVARIQYRQLLDLLGTLPDEADGPQIDAAFERLAALAAVIPAADRTAMLREPGMRLRSPRLIALLAGAEPSVAAAAIGCAELEPEQWLDLAPALPLHARGAMRDRRDLGPVVERQMRRLGILDRGLGTGESPAEARGEPEQSFEPPAPPVPPPEPLREDEGIGAIVRRIEHFRKARRITDGDVPAIDAPRLPLGLPPGENAGPAALDSFDFSTDGEGRLDWADPAAAPMIWGLRLTTSDGIGPASVSAGMATAFARRQPIRGGTIDIAGAPGVAGRWRVDAAPLFDPAGGRFVGYAGRMRRAASSTSAPQPALPPAHGEADRMRQLLHELRTPVNAIQGFAEVIQQQYFGPSPHEYRALAAAIAGDAARLLAGFDELDRLARLDTGALELETGETDLVAVLAGTVARLEPICAARSGGFDLRAEDEVLNVGLSFGDAERLAWRLLATLAGASAPGEMLKLRLRQRAEADDHGGNREARVTVELPASLAASEGEDIFKAALPQGPRGTTQALSAGMFGAGFALRLARSEARAAGGTLERRKGRLRLTLPLLREPSATPALDRIGGEQ